MRPGRRLAVTGAALMLALAGCDSTGDARPATAPSYNFRDSGFDACRQPTGPVPTERALPAVTLPCMDGSGGELALAKAPGVPTVVTLWGSWCAPCGKELPAFEALHHAARGRVAVLGVNTEDSGTNAVAAARELGVTFPSVYDRAGKVRRGLGRNALPVTVFVAADGQVVDVYNAAPLDASTLRALVRKYLGVAVAVTPSPSVGAGR